MSAAEPSGTACDFQSEDDCYKAKAYDFYLRVAEGLERTQAQFPVTFICIFSSNS